ncbi:sigma-70 family RNA polymerase sigma factor [Rapidithrix thailandica]|uniref:Sigma-70 family RNA polymerase sigma factor n=1 Tax=Rapidithrix thailandica TaxID=413964 RepID=A0AAW9S5E6_9BACT
MKDQELWRLVSQGDGAAFSFVYHRYFNDLYLYGLRISEREELVKDVIQELFIDVWSKRERLLITSSIKYYLLKALRRKTVEKLTELQKKQSKTGAFIANQPLISFSQEDFVIRNEEDLQRRQIVAQVLNSLPKRQREAVYLRYFRELSYQEVATMMGLTEKAVVNHVYKAFRKIRKKGALEKIIDLGMVITTLASVFYLVHQAKAFSQLFL